MKNATIRVVLILAAFSILGITITQIYWVRRAFNIESDGFDRSVNTALVNVAYQIFSLNNTPSPSNNPVSQISANYFVVRVNSEIDSNLLEFLLRGEFEKRGIATDFEYGIYNCSSEQMVYGNYVSLGDGERARPSNALPRWSGGEYYFGVQFPNRETHLMDRMGIWLFSTVVMLIVIAFFAYSLFVILRQKRLSEVQRDFINNMTHEFRTPISTIALATGVLKDPSLQSQPDRLQQYAGIIEAETDRLRKNVDRVLNMARIDRQAIELNRESVHINQIIEAIVTASVTVVQQMGGSIRSELDRSDPVVKADRHHLSNAVGNLIDNAVKYSDKPPQILVSTSVRAGQVVVEIEDNGIGISEEHQKRIFQKFYRVSTGNRHDIKGFGLGLSYVKQIVSAHKGTINVFSKPGTGSRFTLHFPAA